MNEPNYDELPVKEADRLIRAKIAYHRDEMGRWALRRGQRLQRELDAGRKPAEIAVDIGTSAQVVYDLSRKARKAAETDDDHPATLEPNIP
jgi:acetyl-CoA acetyltransferase